ncbi:hypothetical protein [Flavobacterium sp.]|jgi:hypothetical protein|uniref:hypothetical protein n=1 Tax=Flavobacterium sp. TaxID=239 RepID=UPI0037BFCBAE
MKILKFLNTIAIGLPIMLLLIGIGINDSAGNYISYALYTTMITGGIQLLLGLIILMKEPRNKYIIAYFLVVIAFFLLWYFNVKILYSDLLTFTLFPIPLLLAIYLSILIYKKEKI